MRRHGLVATASMLVALTLAAACGTSSGTSSPTATPLPTTFVPKVVQSGQLQLTIMDVQDPYQVPAEFEGPTSSDNRYVVVRIVTMNTSSTASGPASPGTFTLQDDVGTVYSEEPPAPGVHHGLFPQLAPLDTFDQSYTFQLPVARGVVALQWQPLDRTVAPVTIQLQ